MPRKIVERTSKEIFEWIVAQMPNFTIEQCEQMEHEAETDAIRVAFGALRRAKIWLFLEEWKSRSPDDLREC